MSEKSKVAVVVVGTGVALIVFGAVWFETLIRSGATSARTQACILNRRYINAAKQHWASENKKATNSIPTWDDLRNYLPQKPACPRGGIYTLGAIGKSAKCSIDREEVPAQ